MSIGKFLGSALGLFGAGNAGTGDLIRNNRNNPDIPPHINRQIRLAQGHPPTESRGVDELRHIQPQGGAF